MKHNPFKKLKEVSGRLRRVLTSHVESVHSEPQLPRLLVIDDEKAFRFSMSEYFGVHGFKVDTARSVEEAEKLIETNDYSVIILDPQLEMTRASDGLEIVKLIHERNPQTPVVVITAYGSAEMEDHARQSGADAFLRKPKPLSEVAQVVQALIESPPKIAAKSA